MRSFGRSITLTAYLVVAALLCLFAVAATTPQPHIKPAGTSRFPDPKPSDAKSSERKSDGPAIAPISLSDPDGQELILEDVSVRTAIEGMLSLTELELRFRNPKPRRLEGRFQCTLPPNAAISRFAKEVNGQLMEGEVVERLRANQVYEQFLHQMRDPALLEQDQGNRFSARIFPIEANASVRVVLSYTTLLPLEHGQRTYSLPLRGIARMNHFTFRAAITTLPGEETVGSEKSAASSSGLKHSTADVLTMEENDFTPQHDVELAFRPSASADRTRVLRAGDFYLAAFRPDVRETQAKASGNWLFYVDTSASSAEGSEHRIHALETLLSALPADDRVEVKTFDNEVSSLAHGNAREVSRAIGGQLRARLFLGGTDVGALLRDVAKAAQNDRTIVVASDLVPTLGTIDRKELSDLVRAIPPHAALHALVLGSREDGQMARTLTAGRGRVVRVPFTDSLEEKARDAAAALSRPLGVSFDVADSQAEWVYPQHVDDVQPGDEIIVLGKSKAASEPAARLSGPSGTVLSANSAARLPAGTFAPLLEREAYRAYLEYLADRESNEPSPAVREALANEQVRISVEQRVVIPQTTMLVLESEWDYQRFGLDRRALASILMVGAVGIERLDRTAPSVIAQQPWPKPPVPQPSPRPMPSMPMRDAVSARAAAAPAAEAAAASSGFGRTDVQGHVADGAPAFDKDFMVDAAAPAAKSVAAAGTVAESITSAPQQARSSPASTNVPSAPPPPPAPMSADSRQAHHPPPTRRREENQGETGNWTHPHRPTADEVDKLRADVTANPADREAYNQLGEALASLGQWSALRTLALQWQPYDPENPQVYELLGTADDHLGNESEEARADASLIEIAPGKPELLQRAGLLLLRAHRASLAETPLRHALQLRPDRVNSYRHLALMLWQDGRTEEAARILESATHQTFPNWYGDAQRVVHEELGYVYRAWIAKEPSRRADIEQRARDYAVDLTRRDAIRVSLAWETDANDVDLHVIDPKGEECFYSHKETGTGLRLYEDITQGLGPEVIRTAKASTGTYQVGVRYFAAGPMGVSRGIVVVLRDTGNDARPSVDIYPFRLVQGGGEVRYVTALNVK